MTTLNMPTDPEIRDNIDPQQLAQIVAGGWKHLENFYDTRRQARSFLAEETMAKSVRYFVLGRAGSLLLVDYDRLTSTVVWDFGPVCQ